MSKNNINDNKKNVELQARYKYAKSIQSLELLKNLELSCKRMIDLEVDVDCYLTFFLKSLYLQAKILYDKNDIEAVEKLLNPSNYHFHNSTYQEQMAIKLENLKIAIMQNNGKINEELYPVFTNIKVAANKNHEIDQLYSKLYYGTLTIDEIKNSDILEIKKDILILAYYNKNQMSQIPSYQKYCKKKYASIPEYLKILNKLFNIANGQSHYFNIGIYNSILGANLIKNNQTTIAQEQEQIKPVIRKPKATTSTESDKIKKEKTVPKYATCVGVNVNNRYKQNTLLPTNVDDNKPEQLIKNTFPNEIEEIGKYLYCSMNNPKNSKNAIKAWDNLSILIEKPITDQQAVDKMLRTIKIFQNAGIIVKDYTHNFSDNKQKKKTL